MRIIQIDVNFDLSSTGRLVKDLKSGMEVLGHEVICFYGRGPESLISDVYKISSDSEVKFHAALTRLTGVTGVYSPLATNKLISRIKSFKPDVVHLHELHGYYVNIYEIIKYLIETKTPTIWTFHCEFMYTGKCGHAYECNRWKSGCGSCPQLYEYPKSLFLDFTELMYRQKKSLFHLFNNLKIITPSKWLLNRVKQSFLKDKKMGVIYNGIDTNIFKPRVKDAIREKYGITTKYVFLSIAPDLLSKNKGGHWVVKLANELAHLDATFIMIGLDKPSDVCYKNIISLPLILNKDVIADYYSMADYTILTSQRETFSLVCAESLACGTPIIGFEAGAPTEVAPDRFGKFVEYGNFQSLLDLLKESLSNKGVFANAQECSEYASGKLSNERMVNAYLSEYQSLIQLNA